MKYPYLYMRGVGLLNSEPSSFRSASLKKLPVTNLLNFSLNLTPSAKKLL